MASYFLLGSSPSSFHFVAFLLEEKKRKFSSLERTREEMMMASSGSINYFRDEWASCSSSLSKEGSRYEKRRDPSYVTQNYLKKDSDRQKQKLTSVIRKGNRTQSNTNSMETFKVVLSFHSVLGCVPSSIIEKFSFVCLVKF